MKLYYPLRNNEEGNTIYVPKTKCKYLLLFTTLDALYKHIQMNQSQYLHKYTILDSDKDGIKIQSERFHRDGEVSVFLPVKFRCGKCYELNVPQLDLHVTKYFNKDVFKHESPNLYYV